MELNKGIKEIEIEGERVFLKKGWFGYQTTNPIQKDITLPIYDIVNKKVNWKNIHWKNLIAGGSWTKLVLIVGFVAISLGAIFEIRSIVQIANECLNSKTLVLLK